MPIFLSEYHVIRFAHTSNYLFHISIQKSKGLSNPSSESSLSFSQSEPLLLCSLLHEWPVKALTNSKQKAELLSTQCSLTPEQIHQATMIIYLPQRAFISSFFFYFLNFFSFIVLGGSTLWHLQKFIQCVKHIFNFLQSTWDHSSLHC
jgi:hypothetical protein